MWTGATCLLSILEIYDIRTSDSLWGSLDSFRLEIPLHTQSSSRTVLSLILSPPSLGNPPKAWTLTTSKNIK